jgi:hypothetical protein
MVWTPFIKKGGVAGFGTAVDECSLWRMNAEDEEAANCDCLPV